VSESGVRDREADLPGPPNGRAPRGGGEGPARVPARSEVTGQHRKEVRRSRRTSGHPHTSATAAVSGENQHRNGSRNGSKEKIAETRSDPGDCNRLEIQDFQRAGDGTRTHDVQLGKEAEKQALSGLRANSRLKTRCSVRRPPSALSDLAFERVPERVPSSDAPDGRLRHSTGRASARWRILSPPARPDTPAARWRLPLAASLGTRLRRTATGLRETSRAASHARAASHLGRQHAPGDSTRSTNSMPVCTARSSTHGRPPILFARSPSIARAPSSSKSSLPGQSRLRANCLAMGLQQDRAPAKPVSCCATSPGRKSRSVTAFVMRSERLSSSR
jgi:hypothetical protein